MSSSKAALSGDDAARSACELGDLGRRRGP